MPPDLLPAGQQPPTLPQGRLWDLHLFGGQETLSKFKARSGSSTPQKMPSPHMCNFRGLGAPQVQAQSRAHNPILLKAPEMETHCTG